MLHRIINNIIKLSSLNKTKRIPKLKPGDKAPGFEVADQDDNIIRLSDMKGKKVVLYFYPKDDTPGCTTESCNLRDNYLLLKKKGYDVIGVSNDSVRSHKKFEKKYKLPFRLAADVDKKIVSDYDVYGKKMLFGRSYDGIHRITYIIDEKG
ncbi:MAG TPA: thioredoxin-dependent thiol peroxidase, partial [Bacteroidia bacterium]|nr:thioredoxin-dependent thiol peroxidase [Bacteroidia bacterium]